MTDTQANQLASLYNQYVLHEGDKVLLWTNSSPTSSFAAQTITISGGFSSYRYLIIECYVNIDATYQSDINANTQYNLRSTSATEFFYISAGAYKARTVNMSKTNGTITFSAASTSSSADNTLCIPYKIYGI